MKMPPLWICLLVVVILLALIVYVSTHRKGVNENVSQFVNNEPKALFVRLVDEFGPPQIIINQKGGFVMWFPSKVYEDSPYESIILKDENITRIENGVEKKNFLYTTVIINIPESKLNEIMTISKNIYYDLTSKEFTVRSDSITTNKRIIIAILKYLTDNNITVQTAKDLLEHTWIDNILDITPFSSTTISDQDDDNIMLMINLNLSVESNNLRHNKELMLY